MGKRLDWVCLPVPAANQRKVHECSNPSRADITSLASEIYEADSNGPYLSGRFAAIQIGK